jgi:hypothetical protein
MTDKEFLDKLEKIDFYDTIYNWKECVPSDVLNRCHDSEPELIFVNDDWELRYEDESYREILFTLKYKLQVIECRVISEDIIPIDYIDRLWNRTQRLNHPKKIEGMEIFKNL